MTKIMLVEDDKALREIYSIRLTAEGYGIVSASDGEEALATAVAERPDLIISDVMMPKISGFDMLDILRSTPETKDIKVIMMTALSSEDQRQRGENLGANKYLVKSQVGIEDVINAVHEILGDKPMPAQGAGVVSESGNGAAATQVADTNGMNGATGGTNMANAVAASNEKINMSTTPNGNNATVSGNTSNVAGGANNPVAMQANPAAMNNPINPIADNQANENTGVAAEMAGTSNGGVAVAAGSVAEGNMGGGNNSVANPMASSLPSQNTAAMQATTNSAMSSQMSAELNSAGSVPSGTNLSTNETNMATAGVGGPMANMSNVSAINQGPTQESMNGMNTGGNMQTPGLDSAGAAPASGAVANGFTTEVNSGVMGSGGQKPVINPLPKAEATAMSMAERMAAELGESMNGTENK